MAERAALVAERGVPAVTPTPHQATPAPSSTTTATPPATQVPPSGTTPLSTLRPPPFTLGFGDLPLVNMSIRLLVSAHDIQENDRFAISRAALIAGNYFSVPTTTAALQDPPTASGLVARTAMTKASLTLCELSPQIKLVFSHTAKSSHHIPCVEPYGSRHTLKPTQNVPRIQIESSHH